jgi:hypothetical protein
MYEYFTMFIQSDKQQFWYQQYKQATGTLVPLCHFALLKLVTFNFVFNYILFFYGFY